MGQDKFYDGVGGSTSASTSSSGNASSSGVNSSATGSATMSKKIYVAIYKNVSSGACESSDYAAYLADAGLTGVVTIETTADVQCETYGKTEGEFCMVDNHDGYQATEFTCVLGFDDF